MNSTDPQAPENTKRDHPERRMRRAHVGMAFFAACIGSVSFFNVAGKPRFEAYHTLDVMRLVLAGAGFGVALVLLIQFFKLGIWKEHHGDGADTPSDARKE